MGIAAVGKVGVMVLGTWVMKLADGQSPLFGAEDADMLSRLVAGFSMAAIGLRYLRE